MLRITSSCCLCTIWNGSGRKAVFPTTQLKWKSWSTTSRIATKPASESSQEVDQFDLSQLQNVECSSLPDKQDRLTQLREHERSSPKVVETQLVSVESGTSKRPQTSLPKYCSYTVAETVQSVRGSYNRPLQLVNAADPALLEKAVKLDTKEILKCYLGLSKSRLTGLVVITAMAGYALAPAPFAVESFVSLTLGTALTSASANTVNQIVEVQFDSQMDRTKNRVLVRQKLSKEHAAAFAAISGVTGLALLTIGANGLTAALGGLNLLLYTCIYTPMKQQSIANTWVGSVVGGIPPLMGWVACSGEISHGALLLGGILYAWQFPHFNALSWNLRNDYNKAGYKMMAISHPELCRKTSLRYSLSLILISSLAPVCNVTSWFFVIDSLPLNGYLAYLAYKFYQDGDSASSRKLFRFSLIHLPTLILLMMVSKKAYAEKSTECPITSAINEASSSIHVPPTPPVTFASINSNYSEKDTNSSSMKFESSSYSSHAVQSLSSNPTPRTL